MASTTSDESMMEPSTMASGESASTATFWTWNDPFRSRSSTSLTAELPMSRPTTPLARAKSATGLTPPQNRCRHGN